MEAKAGNDILEILSSISSPTQDGPDINMHVRKTAGKLASLLPYSRCLVIHECASRTTSYGFVYQCVRSGEGQHYSLHDQSGFQSSIGIEKYLRHFDTSDRQDYGFQWRGSGSIPGAFSTSAGQLAANLQCSEGIAAHVQSRTADALSSLVQLECELKNISRQAMLLLSHIAFCLHSHFSIYSAHPDLQKQSLGKSLTNKEIDVLKWVVEGKTSWEIGRILETSERTVKFHLRNIYTKLNVKNRAQAVAAINKIALM